MKELQWQRNMQILTLKMLESVKIANYLPLHCKNGFVQYVILLNNIGINNTN